MGKYDGTSSFWMEELEYDSWPARRHGGQHVGVSSGVIVRHVPTGIAVVRYNERSQLKNRDAAVEQLRIILDKLYGDLQTM